MTDARNPTPHARLVAAAAMNAADTPVSETTSLRYTVTIPCPRGSSGSVPLPAMPKRVAGCYFTDPDEALGLAQRAAMQTAGVELHIIRVEERVTEVAVMCDDNLTLAVLRDLERRIMIDAETRATSALARRLFATACSPPVESASS